MSVAQAARKVQKNQTSPLMEFRLRTSVPGELCLRGGLELHPWQLSDWAHLSEMNLNLPENSDSVHQQQILDALPILIFLERAGRIVFANSEARQMLGSATGAWIPCAVEEVLWGLLPGTAEPQTRLTGSRRGSPFHATHRR